MTYWKDKVAVVTGGSAGLGKELAHALVQSQASVAVVARNQERLANACKELGPNTHGFAADVTDARQVEQLRADVINRFGKVDALFNCAGKSSRGAVVDTRPEEFQQLFELNFLSVVRCTQTFVPVLTSARGHVVNIGSLASKVASSYLGAYPASKHPVAAFSQQLRLELSGKLHVLLVCPGPIARPDAGVRYDAARVPDNARKPGGGVKLRGIDPCKLSRRILAACASRQLELVVPAKARLLFVLAQISPRCGDWLIRKMTS